MSTLSRVGRAVSNIGSTRRGVLGVAGLGLGIAGLQAANTLSTQTFDAASEILLGNAEADRALIGADMGWGNFWNPLGGPVEHAAAGGAVGFLGGAVGGTMGMAGLASMGKLNKWSGAATMLGALGLGTTAGAVGGAATQIAPYVNSTTMGWAFRDDKAAEARMNLAQANVDAGWNTTNIPDSIFDYGGRTMRTGVAQDQGYYGTSFPGPTSRNRRNYTTGATGDIVLGAYNLRMG